MLVHKCFFVVVVGEGIYLDFPPESIGKSMLHQQLVCNAIVSCRRVLVLDPFYFFFYINDITVNITSQMRLCRRYFDL